MKTTELDRVVLQSLYGDSHDNQIEVFSEFLRSYSEIRKSLFSAFESGNISSLKRMLHYHGPSFIYLGLPRVADMFIKLEFKSSQTDNHFTLSADFSELMKAVEEGWLQLTYEMEDFRKAV